MWSTGWPGTRSTCWPIPKWNNFLNVICKAKTACDRSGHNIADHFADIGKMVELGSGNQREKGTWPVSVADTRLTMIRQQFDFCSMNDRTNPPESVMFL